jgi:ABC-type polysaccharide/polyol phosphate export permease
MKEMTISGASLADYQTALFLAWQQLKRRHVNSVLGVLWAFGQSFAQVIVFMLVFTVIFPNPTDRFFRFLIAGLMPWNFLSASLNSAAQSLVARREMLECTSIRGFVFVLVDVFTEAFLFLTVFFTTLLIGSWFVPIPPVTFAVLPVAMLPIMIFVVAFAYAIAHLNARMRDVGHLFSVVFPILFWLTPIAYHWDQVPAKVMPFLQLNPFVHLLAPIQIAVHQARLDLLEVGRALCVSGVAVIVALFVHRTLAKTTIYYL